MKAASAAVWMFLLKRCFSIRFKVQLVEIMLAPCVCVSVCVYSTGALLANISYVKLLTISIQQEETWEVKVMSITGTGGKI